MAKYLFIASRDPYESGDSANFLELVRGAKIRRQTVAELMDQHEQVRH